MPIRKGKALESILKHPDQAGAAKENQSSAASPSAPVSCITVSTPIITASAKNIPTAAIKNTAASDTSSPQYHYSTPIEDPAVVLKVVNRALNIPISITQRELLSISPEAQKQYKELPTTRQVSAGTTEVSKLEEVPDNSLAVYSSCMVHNPDSTNDLRVGCNSIPLCSIFLLIKGKLMVEWILDSGFQIVAMNNVIWEKLGNNLQVEQALKMEATNSTITKMHGHLCNIRFTFNDIDIYPQVQVMPNASYNILLGHLFYALTECITKDFANKDQHLTITNPQYTAICHDSNKRTEKTLAPRPGFLVVEQSYNWQDYTIHPYFILGTVFPPQPLSSCPGLSSQSLSVPVILLKTVIPPSHRKEESPVLFTEKTVLTKEKAASTSVSVPDNEISKSLLPFSLPLNSKTVTSVQVLVPTLDSVSSSINCTELSCHPFGVCYSNFGTKTPTSFSHSPPLFSKSPPLSSPSLLFSSPSLPMFSQPTLFSLLSLSPSVSPLLFSPMLSPPFLQSLPCPAPLLISYPSSDVPHSVPSHFFVPDPEIFPQLEGLKL
jgi:hypothetical protein